MTDPSLPRINIDKISEVAYQILREKIVNKEFSPGQRLDLDAIEKKLGVSRTPLKEALTRLELEGLVEIVSRSGTFIANPSPEEIGESSEVRRVLEVYAIEQAVGQANDDDIKKLRTLIQEMSDLAAIENPELDFFHHQNLDQQFHEQLVALAGNQRLCQAHKRENLHAWMDLKTHGHPLGSIKTSQEHHERILAALERRDAETAKAELDAHLKWAKQWLMDNIGAAH